MVLMKNYIPLGATNQNNATDTSGSTIPTSTNTSSTGGSAIPRKKERPLLGITIPSYVTKIEDTKTGGKFICNPCQSHCNSDIQLSQHLASKKHLDKVARKLNSSNSGMGDGGHINEVTVTSSNYQTGTIFCHVCKLSFHSQSVLDTHFMGSKHQRKLKSIELGKSLVGTEPGFKYDSNSSEIKCTICDVVFYSPQHITRHIEGEKHQTEKGKRENGDEGGTPAKKHCTGTETQGRGNNGQATTTYDASESNAISTITSTSAQAASKKSNINVPSFVSRIDEPKTAEKFVCNPCQATCNSDIQLSQHLSSKKHLDKMALYCEVCLITFTSEVLVDTHIIGAKHQRRLKSRELLKSLEAVEPCFSFDIASGEVRCNLCNVTLYSPHHIMKHIEGENHTKHKTRLQDGTEEANLALKLLLSASLDQTDEGSDQPISSAQATNATSITTPTSGVISLATSMPTKKERPPLAINIPAYVTKMDDTKIGGKFLCNPCQTHCNSDIQLLQHLSSKKHSDKISGRKRSPTGVRGSWRGSRGGPPMGRGRGISSRPQRMDPLAQTSAFHSSSNPGAYSHSSFTDSNLPTSYSSDSYGLSSLGRGAVSEYGGFGRSGGSGRGGGGRGGSLGRAEVRGDGDYGRGVGVYGRPDGHPRSDYGGNFPAGRAEELSYGRAAAEYAPRGYGSGQGVSHVSGRGIPFTYTQPLSQNFVSGGTIL